jgi:hypothetical protein
MQSNVSTGQRGSAYLSFPKAKKAAREWAAKRHIATRDDWRANTSRPDFPTNLPKSPDKVYAKTGHWTRWSDWIGATTAKKN